MHLCGMERDALRLESDERQALQSGAWFAGLSAALRHDMLRSARVARFASGELIQGRRDPQGIWMACARGTVGICGATRERRYAMLDLVEPGQWFGELALLDAGPPGYDAYARGATTVLQIDASSFRALAAQHVELYQALLAQMVQWRRDLEAQVDDIKTLGLGQRLAKELWQRAFDHGAAKGRSVRITLCLAQHELAQLLGASRQRVNQQLKGLERQQVIRIGARQVEVRDLGKLQSLWQQ